MSDKEVINKLTRNIGKVYTQFGFSEIIGQVWTILHFTKPLTQSEIKKELNCSLSAVSQALKLLEKVGAVKETGKKGRQKLYTVEPSLRQINKKKMELALNSIIIPINEHLENALKEAKDKELKEKIKKLKLKFSKAEKLIKVIRSITI